MLIFDFVSTDIAKQNKSKIYLNKLGIKYINI